MKRKIEEILDQLVAEMNKGRNIDDCLREYPDHADELRPLLHLVQQITALPKPEPDANLLEAVISKARKSSIEQQARRGFSFRRSVIQNPVLVRVFAVVTLLFVAGATTVSVSAHSLPGDLLYPVKKLAEDVQYFITVDAEGRARLHVRFADRRTYELSCLLRRKARIDQGLLAEMLNETKSAIDCTEFLDDEVITEIVKHLDVCNHHQMALLEETKQSDCDFDIKAIEEAIKTCLEQHNCIECMKDNDRASGTNCPSADGRYDHILQ